MGPPLLLLCLIISALNNKIVSMSRTKDRFQFLEAQIVDITESGILFLRVDVYHHLYSDHLYVINRCGEYEEYASPEPGEYLFDNDPEIMEGWQEAYLLD